MRDKCIIFFGEIRTPELCYNLFKQNFNIDEYDVYISGWDRDIDNVKKLASLTNTIETSIINPEKYLKKYNISSSVLYDKCSQGNCRIFGQYISIDNIKNFNIKKYKEVLITRPDIYLKFTRPDQIEDNCIYDQPFITNMSDYRKRYSLYGFFFYGNGNTISRICDNFFENVINFFDFNESYKKILENFNMDLTYACSSPRCMWYVGCLKDKNIKIRIIDDLECHLVRPGVEKYNWRDPITHLKWSVYKKYKMFLSRNSKEEQLTFESIDMATLSEHSLFKLLDSVGPQEDGTVKRVKI